MSDSDPGDGVLGTGFTLGDIGHTALDLLGMVPVLGEPADVANAAWHAAEGNYLDAGLSLIAVIPVVGDAIGKGGKLAKALGGKLGSKALDTLRSLNFGEILSTFRRNPRLAPHVDKIIEALETWRQGLFKRFSDCSAPGQPAGCPLVKARAGQQAKDLLASAAQAEKRVTPDLQDLAGQRGMTMEGLDYRLKTEESLTRKLADTPADQIGDALRYTMTSSADDLAANASRTLADLQSKGYEVVKVKNTFVDGAPYKGLNTQLRSPEGQLFELQFHTPGSFDVKQNVTHGLYEEWRQLADGNPRKSEIAAQLVRLSSVIPNPPGLAEALKGFAK